MESNWNTSLPWLPGVEQDFSLGAKASPYLPSATAGTSYENDTFELPDWMESRENLGLSNMDIFDDVKFESFDDAKFDASEQDISYDTGCEITEMEEDYTQTIRPEDMLVPLAELQPEKYAPQGIRANTVLVTSSIPKVSVRVNRIQVTAPRQENKRCLSDFQAHQAVALQHPSSQILQPQNFNKVSYESVPSYNAEELINELVDMASDEPNGLTDLISSFDASVVQAGMDDLLSQLESSDAGPQLLDVSPWSSEPASPVSLPSPVPSVGSLSPQSTNDKSFHHLTPTYTSDDSSVELEHEKEVDFHSILSPSSVDSVSVSSPSYIDDESDMEYSKPEMHSYSRSPSKRKTSRKSSGRKTSIPEGRKERKKEQNKQAALRYRQKKKLEDDDLASKIEAEEERQRKLKARYTNLKQELTYLKKIMREVLIAKGAISPEAFKKK